MNSKTLFERNAGSKFAMYSKDIDRDKMLLKMTKIFC